MKIQISSFWKIVEKKGILLVFIITLTAFVSVDVYEVKIHLDYPVIGGVVTGDEPHYLAVTSEIIQRHNVYMDEYFSHQDPKLIWPHVYYNNSAYWESFQRDDGHWMMGGGPGVSFMLVPGYAVAGVFGALVTMSALSSLTSVFIYKFTSNLSTPKIGFLTTIIFSFSTLLFTWSNQIYPDVVITLFLIVILYVIFEKNQNNVHMAAAGALVGFGFFLKIFFIILDLALIPLVFLLLLTHKINLKNFMVFLSFFIILTSLAIINNIYMYHSLVGGAEARLSLGAITPLHFLLNPPFSNGYSGYGVFGGGDTKTWAIPELIEIFFGKYHGLFIFSPVVMLSVLGIKSVLNKNRLLLTTIIIISALDIGSYTWMNPISSMDAIDSPFRYFLPTIPLMTIPFALGLQKFSKNWIYRILISIFSVIGASFVFSFSFIGGRLAECCYNPIKGNLVHTIYQGFDFILPSIGPLSHPENHPFNSYNQIFVIVMIIMLSIGVLIPFFLKDKSKQVTKIV
ncbi:MAG: glycosyltransferase family 39 protein [Thaumarchaeota archaeon]|nr:glycosyltransferase family 39 protein [Nitrososphaerota archaeon]